MAKFTVTVRQTEVYEFEPVEIEAEDEEAADAIAEEMRVNGELGPAEMVDCTDVDIAVERGR